MQSVVVIGAGDRLEIWDASEIGFKKTKNIDITRMIRKSATAQI